MKHNDKQTLLKISGLQKHYGSTAAIADVSLELREGELLTFLGPSGSGKTTVLMSIAGFVQPSAGSIDLAGKPLLPLEPYQRNIGMVFQSYALFPHMTVAKNVAYPLSIRRMPKAQIEEKVARVLELVGLPQHANRLPSELSGGQQQRVALARAIVFEPRLLLMDEPLAALDKKLRAKMQMEIMRLHRELGVSIIYVTHDQEEALVMSDRIAVFNHGRIDQIGTPSELYDAPKTRFVADFIGESNLFDGKIQTIGADGVWCALPCGATIRLAEANAARKDGSIVVAVRPERIRVHHASHEPACENVLPAVVSDVAYLGQARKYLVRTATGTEIVALEQLAVQGQRTFEIGEPVVVSWRASDTREVNS
ncbi:ABC transporter ATP-binding protein [Paraburkholderia sp. Ac-20336]|uniref:ABC transporter ATP-binding protein n=1 Tax=Paraburkholderia sp. Ac-20336 TaxID=2703886 RepID=UPI00198238AD|nr:ABC transporter ATP-binding protein [Paraburkholderia sp. Ac-20336]MBN3801716.1 ABC transporter ATP-binding protein [Paraburkholderia sp. Ac-20336]